MRVIMFGFGAAAILLGLVWILQGVNVLPGSFMTGDIKWAAYGAILAVVGIILVMRGRRR